MTQPDPAIDVLGVVIGIDRGDLGAAIDMVAAALPHPVVVIGERSGVLGASSDCDVLRLPADELRLRAVIREHAWVVIHDPACPAVRSHQVRDLAGRPGEAGVVLVQPVLETLKLVRDRVVVSTVDREQLRVVGSPMAAPGPSLARIPDLLAALDDPAILVAALRELGPVELVEGPPDVRRVSADPAN